MKFRYNCFSLFSCQIDFFTDVFVANDLVKNDFFAIVFLAKHLVHFRAKVDFFTVVFLAKLLVYIRSKMTLSL